MGGGWMGRPGEEEVMEVIIPNWLAVASFGLHFSSPFSSEPENILYLFLGPFKMNNFPNNSMKNALKRRRNDPCFEKFLPDRFHNSNKRMRRARKLFIPSEQLYFPIFLLTVRFLVVHTTPVLSPSQWPPGFSYSINYYRGCSLLPPPHVRKSLTHPGHHLVLIMPSLIFLKGAELCQGFRGNKRSLERFLAN